MRQICTFLFCIFYVVSYGQINVINNNNKSVWKSVGFVTSDSAIITPVFATEFELQKTLSITSGLLGFQKERKFKNVHVKLLPYFFGSYTSEPTNSFVDTRIGVLKDNEKTHYRFDALFHVKWNPYKYISLNVGRGKHKLGEGYSSLLWNGEGSPMWFAEGNFDSKMFNYTVRANAINDLAMVGVAFQNNLKYAVNHTVTVKLKKDWKITLFESVLWSAIDSVYSRGFDWNYVPPTIFYRPAEFAGGSADNVLIGLNWSGNLYKKWKTYGQLVLDEFFISDIKAWDGSWRNKYGIQLGLKHNSKTSKLLMELNFVRPFTYSHANTRIAYTNQGVPLGAWWGAGFVSGTMRYSRFVKERLELIGTTTAGVYEGTGYGNTGGNPFLTYESRTRENGFYVGKETSEKVIDASIAVMYQLKRHQSYISFWSGAILNTTKNEASPWVQVKLGNYLYSNFRKNRSNVSFPTW